MHTRAPFVSTMRVILILGGPWSSLIHYPKVFYREVRAYLVDIFFLQSAEKQRHLLSVGRSPKDSDAKLAKCPLFALTCLKKTLHDPILRSSKHAHAFPRIINHNLFDFPDKILRLSIFDPTKMTVIMEELDEYWLFVLLVASSTITNTILDFQAIKYCT